MSKEQPKPEPTAAHSPWHEERSGTGERGESGKGAAEEVSPGQVDSDGETVPAGDGSKSERRPTLYPGQRIGRFILLQPLGAGGMSVVWAAYDPQLERQVAIKLVRFYESEPSASGSGGRSQLLREALALARVSHPNVVSVYEVGTHGDEDYVARELVRGVDLSAWLHQRTRGAREIIEIFRQAGAGLAAAHRAGVVHRDFKPANVLVDEEGRARVADFGLARFVKGGPVVDPLEVPMAQGGVVDRSPHTVDVTSGTTHGGMLRGTPSFMSPELIKTGHADAQSDQYAFCVSLYLALYRVLPFGGGGWQEQLRVKVDSLALAHRMAHVPSWLRAVILRGLRPKPEDRFASMDDLLRVLAKDPAHTRYRAVAIAAALAAVFGVVVGRYDAMWRRDRLCDGAPAKIASVWGAARQRAVREAFLATQVPYAADAWRTVEQTLSRDAEAWVEMWKDSCVSTRIRGEQPEDAFNLREGCLSAYLAERKALIDLFAAGDRKVVERAAQAVSELTPIARCSDVNALRAPLSPPTNPALRDRVEKSRQLVIKALALGRGGRYAEGLAVADEALAEARAVDHKPLLAEALHRRGSILAAMHRSAESVPLLEEAFEVALVCHHDEVAFDTAGDLAYEIGYVQAQGAQGLGWTRVAHTLMRRVSNDEAHEARVATNTGIILAAQGKLEQALELHQRVLAVRERVHGPEHQWVAATLHNIAMCLMRLGRYEEAIKHFQRSIAIREKTQGPEHPRVALALNNLATTLISMGEADEALASAQRAYAAFVRALGPDSMESTIALVTVAEALTEAGRLREAEAEGERALATAKRTLDEQNVVAAAPYDVLGRIMEKERRFDRALEYYGHARALHEKLFGPKHANTATTVGHMAACRAAQGKRKQAVEELEAALPVIEKQSESSNTLAELRFVLADALFRLGKQRGRAVELARASRDGWAKLPSRKRELAEVEAWLASHHAP